MEFIIKQSVLKNELGFVQGIVDKKTTIPVLANILIESVGENTVRMTGTDMEITIRSEFAAEIKKPGAICVQARKLFEIVRLLQDGDLHFEKDENEWVKLTSSRSKYRLAGVSRSDYPEVAQYKSTPMKISAEAFNYFVQHTSFAITSEQSRFTLSGAKFRIENGAAMMVTTDGHRLALIKRDIPQLTGSETLDALIPKKALSELSKIARESTGEIAFGEDENNIFFQIDGRILVTRKLTGTFPNYEMVIPKDHDKTAVFDAEEMGTAIRRASLMADERTRSVRMLIKTGEIEVGAQSSEEGEALEKLPCEYTGEDVEVAFNAAYLQDFFNVVSQKESVAAENESDGEKVRVKEGGLKIAFEFKDSGAQTVLKIAGDTQYDYKYIVMPLRV